MEKYEWITSVEDEEGAPLRINQQEYYYCAPWYRIRDESEKQGVRGGNDITAATHLLNQLGIPALRTHAFDTVEDEDGHAGGWMVYWA